MSKATDTLHEALARAMRTRPAIGGFPFLAETLRRAGVTRNVWTLPACQSLYLTQHGPVVTVGTPLASEMADVPPYDHDALVNALREDQVGHTTFPEFLEAAWRAGVVRYEVDFLARKVAYSGALGEVYVEEYAAADLPDVEP